MANPRFTQSDEEELIGRALAALGPAFTNWLAQQQGGIEQLVGAGAPPMPQQIPTQGMPPMPPQGAAQATSQMPMPQDGDRVMDVLARYGLI